MSTSAPNRVPQADVHEQFLTRWSPRAFEDRPISTADVSSLFEAARWAPSCFNEQPWLFVYGTDADDHARIASLLVDGNRAWAEKAPLLGIVFAKRAFARGGKTNRWGAFDAGAASLSLALQAEHLGLSVHFMGGIHEEACYDALGVSQDDYEAVAGFSVGYRGDPASLPEALAAREGPSGRKPLAEVAYAGSFGGGEALPQ